MSASAKKTRGRTREYLDGQLLLAMPGMTDPRFARSVIYVCAHTKDGAMGIVINRKSRRVTFDELLAQLDVIPTEDEAGATRISGGVPVLKGGPVDTQRGFVLHSSDFSDDDATMRIDSGVSLTASVDILRAIVNGKGPHRAILALGYAGWAAGQLESEFRENGWLNCPADPDLLFDGDLDGKYIRALEKLGVDPAMLVHQSGNA